MRAREKIMKKSATNSKNTASKTEKGLKHLKLVGVGRKYIESRLNEMKETETQKALPDKNSSNGEKVRK